MKHNNIIKLFNNNNKTLNNANHEKTQFVSIKSPFVSIIYSKENISNQQNKQYSPFKKRKKKMVVSIIGHKKHTQT